MGLHVVTGASAGMGRACAVQLAEAGHDIIAVARRADVLAELAPGTTNVTVVAADVASADGRSAIVDAVGQRPGPVASVIHGAATAVELEPWGEIDPDELTAHFAVHVAAPVALTATLHGRVGVERCLMFDSYSASTPRVGWSAYSILKAAAQMAFRTAAEELPDVAVARVFPGAVSTPLLDRVLAADRSIEATSVYHELNDRGRVSTANEIGAAVVDLLALPLEEFGAREVWHIGHPADLD